MGTWAALLVQLVPSLIAGLLTVVDAARSNPGTAEDVKARLDRLSAELADLNQRIQAMPLPGDDEEPPDPGA